MKRISLLGLLGVCVSLFPNMSFSDGLDYKDIQPLSTFSELLPGERIDYQSGVVGHYLETISIKGNGMPITLGHRFYNDQQYDFDVSRVSLEVPRIEFIRTGNVGVYHANKPYKTNFNCSNLKLANNTSKVSMLLSGIRLRLGYKEISFFPASQDVPSRFPDSVKYVSPSNWYIECVGSDNVFGSNAFKAVSPKGIEYLFDVYQDINVERDLLGKLDTSKYSKKSYNYTETKVYVSEVKDLFNNKINYSYDRKLTSHFYPWNFPYDYGTNKLNHLRVRISAITASDGRGITITHMGDISNTIKIKSTDSPNVDLTYKSFGPGENLRITRNDGKFWEYNFSQPLGYGPFRLDKVKYPNDLRVAYDYPPDHGEHRRYNRRRSFNYREPSNPFIVHSALGKRTITGQGMTPYVESYYYNDRKWDDAVNDVNITFVETPENSREYHHRFMDYTLNPKNSPVNGGKLLKMAVYPKGVTFQTRLSAVTLQETVYNYSRVANVVNIDYLSNVWDAWVVNAPGNHRIRDFLGNIHHSYRTKVSKKTTQINGYTFTTQYSDHDKFGHAKTITESNTQGDSRVTRRTFHNDEANWIVGQLKSESIDGETAKSTFTYNADGTLNRKIVNGIGEFYTYLSDGNLHQIKHSIGGALVPVKTFMDYKRGIARDTTDGVGNSKRTEVYDFGQVKSETDFNGNPATHYQYDSLHRLKKITPPSSRLATYISWPTELKKVVTQGGYKQTTDFNAMMQPLLVTEEDINRSEKVYTKTVYDESGKVTFSSFPFSAEGKGMDSPSKTGGTRYFHDGLGRIISTYPTGGMPDRYMPINLLNKYWIIPNQTTYCYGLSCGNGTKHGTLTTDARGNKTIKNYRAYGNPSNKDLMFIKEQKNTSEYITTTIQRGKHGQITNINQDGKNRKFIYRQSKLLLDRKIEPEVGTTYYRSYDPRGNLLKMRVGASGDTIYKYDNNGRITDIDYPGSTLDVSYKYDGSNLERITTGANKTVLDYLWNDHNGIKYETLTIDGLRFVTHYEYDGLGNLDYVRLPSIEYPSSARVIDSTVDALGRTREIDGFVSDVKYYPNGVLSDMTHENGIVFRSELNDKKLPLSLNTFKDINVDSRNTIVNLVYGYDKNNNVTNITNYQNRSNDRDMGYDGLNRMTTANGSWGNGSIEYTDNHDIDNMTLGSKTLYYGYDNSGKLTHTTGSINKNFGYDKYGNVTGNGTDSFIYDDANQMLKVSNKNIHYSYDGNKKRVKVQTPEKTVYYFYNLAGELLYRYDKTKNNDIEYINLNGKLIAKFEQSDGSSTDTDGDGISDKDEIAQGTDPNKADTDGDGVNDGEERSLGTNPNNPDTDGDGVNDGTEAVLGTNPKNADTDGDGVSDGDEVTQGTDPNVNIAVLMIIVNSLLIH